MSQKAHGKKDVNPANCDCQLKFACSEIKFSLKMQKKIMRCPIVPEGHD